MPRLPRNATFAFVLVAIIAISFGPRDLRSAIVQLLEIPLRWASGGRGIANADSPSAALVLMLLYAATIASLWLLFLMRSELRGFFWPPLSWFPGEDDPRRARRIHLVLSIVLTLAAACYWIFDVWR